MDFGQRLEFALAPKTKSMRALFIWFPSVAARTPYTSPSPLLEGTIEFWRRADAEEVTSQRTQPFGKDAVPLSGGAVDIQGSYISDEASMRRTPDEELDS
ncbi:hypothetical protein AB4Y44_28010 [Paraburkholderia sp. BR10937]|uniref:hypothetical protein n=1 Tax=Paraburkholderia sp. BR10937 TaxID=3236994 RepID=UPI0034D255EA